MRVDDATQREAVGGRRAERQLVAGAQELELRQETKRGSWWQESRVVAGPERGVAAGQERGEQQKLVAGPGRGVGGWTGERAVAAGQERGEQQKLAWKNGGAVNTRH